LIAIWFAAVLPVLLAQEAGGQAAPAQPAPSSPPLLEPAPRRPAESERQPERIELKDAKDGSGDLVYEATSFTARVAPDGSVRFTDKRATGLTPIPWWPMKTMMPVPSLQSSLKNLLKEKSPPPQSPTEIDVGLAPPVTKQLIPEVSQYRPDAREGCRQCAAFNEVAVPFLGFGRADLTDELTRFSGQDPYRQQKAMFLASTRDERISMAVRMHAANIRRANAELPPRLQAIACDDRLSYKERRSILVALGREMDSTTPAGASASKLIAGYITQFDAGEVACAK
jgi:hypothetical protein